MNRNDVFMDYLGRLMTAFELHSPEEIRVCFNNGIDPNDKRNGSPLINELVNMYSRGPQFKECVKVFVEYGLQFEDKALLCVLLDDAGSLDAHLRTDNAALHATYSFNGTFTPLYNVSLLHICAEYNHLACARVLLKYGANINEKAGLDENGFGGHTPIFNTVNQHNNKYIDMLQFLLLAKADLDITVKGIIWGKGYEWETFIPSVNPVSYAMMGLLRQFQRTEEQIYEIVSLLMKAKYGLTYTPTNLPNKYLTG